MREKAKTSEKPTLFRSKSDVIKNTDTYYISVKSLKSKLLTTLKEF